MVRDWKCGSCQFHLIASTLNVAIATVVVYSGGLIGMVGLPFSLLGWALHYYGGPKCRIRNSENPK